MPDQGRYNVGVFVLGFVILAVCFSAGYLLLSRKPAEPPAAGEADTPGAVETGPAAADANVAYQLDFNAPGDEWNRPITSVTSDGLRPYLGDFFPDSKPALTLRALPAHKLLRVTFDLYLMKSWDGSSPIWGPGLFDVMVGGDDGRSLLHATFCNCGFFGNNNEQSFPDNYPSRPFPAWTLATEKMCLGTVQDWGGGDKFDASGVYHMVFTFPHDASDVVLNFQSVLPGNAKKPFGFANMKVQTLPELAAFSAAEMEQLWRDLGNVDPAVFYPARWKLVSAGDAATDYIGKHYGDLKMPANPFIFNPGGTVLPYPMEVQVIHRERARWVLEAIHTPAALALKKEIPTVLNP